MKKLDSIIEKILLINLSIYCIALTFTYSAIYFDFSIVNLIVRYSIKLTFFIAILVLFYNACRRFYNLKQLIFIFVIGVLLSISYLHSHTGMLLIIFIYIMDFLAYDSKKIIKLTFFAILGSVIFIFISSFFHSSNGYNVIQNRILGERVRYSMGFWYSAYISNHFLTILLLYAILKDKWKLYDFIIIFIINLILFVFTDTKYIFILSLLLLLFKALQDKINIKILFYISALSIPLGIAFISILSYFLSKNYQFADIINGFVSGRLGLVVNGFKLWGIHLFGSFTNMSIDSSNYNYVDPQYMAILFNDGLIPFILYIVYFIYLCYNKYKLNNKAFLIVMLIASLHTIFDPQLFTLHLSPFILYLERAVFNEKY